MSGKGSGRRPGEGYQDNFSRIFGEKAREPTLGAREIDAVLKIPLYSSEGADSGFLEVKIDILPSLIGPGTSDCSIGGVLQLAEEALMAVQRSHGVQLTSYPPQDAWLVNRVDEKVRAALLAIDAAKREDEQ